MVKDGINCEIAKNSAIALGYTGGANEIIIADRVENIPVAQIARNVFRDSFHRNNDSKFC
ncbi:MAG: hypothetical protein LBU73_05650 [Helicobacteraceae bacterium]|nr:hypothetical protein [Helicobacteraceae bacterium]